MISLVYFCRYTHYYIVRINDKDVCYYVWSGLSSSVSHSAPGVQFLAERKSVPPRHQALLTQHQVPPGHRQCSCTSTCWETLLSHLHEVTASGFSPHQALLQFIGKVTISSKLLYDLLVVAKEADAVHLYSLFKCVSVLHQVILGVSQCFGHFYKCAN